jgi:hypothetical protein
VSKKLSPTKRLWVEDNGSIYVAEADDVVTDFSKKTIKVRTAIAFNVGDTLAKHIVSIHNQAVGLGNFAEFLSGSPERYK